MTSGGRDSGWRPMVAWVVIAFALVYTVFPVFWLFSNSLKSRLDMFAVPPLLIPHPTLYNYIQAFVERPFLIYMLNSLIVAVFTTILSLAIGTMAGYALARYDYGRAKRHVAFWILSTRMMPPIVSIVPLYIFFSVLHLLDSKMTLVIAYTGFNLPFVTWMMRSYFADIPRDLEESAQIDGDTALGAFLRIILPLARPGLAATAIFCLILSWNEFLFALILTETENANTLPIGIAGRITQYKTEWGEISASGFAACVPIVLFAFAVQRHLVRGLSFGAVKG
ncbi:MAG TPA: carbohydrate ABC transporter permease [Dongiaceae bacterium]|jgi:multiple sugar transport system permease protein|nr:carbohydrate ABC transporter permease [Dongiaceae bacterium]